MYPCQHKALASTQTRKAGIVAFLVVRGSGAALLQANVQPERARAQIDSNYGSKERQRMRRDQLCVRDR